MTAIFFARDAGAANQVIAIVDLLAGHIECPALLALIGRLAGEMPRAAAIFGAGPALDVFAAAGASACEFNPADAAAAARFLDEQRAQILVTGTGDVDDRATPALWIAASRLGIPSIAALDSADNIQFRFNPSKGELPGWFVAPDARSADGLLCMGIASSNIVCVNNLHHARLAQAPRPQRVNIRRNWDVTAAARVVLFVSENAAEARAMGRPVDFDEFSLLSGLIESIGARRPIGSWRYDKTNDEIVVVVRPHPRDLPGKYDSYARPSGPRVIVSGSGTPAEAVTGADLVVGMRSALLDEAHILGRPVHRLI
jgi:hypothetical protein